MNDKEWDEIEIEAEEYSEGDVVGDDREEARRRVLSFRIRTMMLGIVVFGVGFGVLLDPVIGPLILSALGMFGLVLILCAGTILLGWVGFLLFAIYDRFIAYLRRLSTWDEPGP